MRSKGLRKEKERETAVELEAEKTKRDAEARRKAATYVKNEDLSKARPEWRRAGSASPAPEDARGVAPRCGQPRPLSISRAALASLFGRAGRRYWPCFPHRPPRSSGPATATAAPTRAEERAARPSSDPDGWAGHWPAVSVECIVRRRAIFSHIEFALLY